MRWGEGCGPDQQNAHKRPLEEAAHTLSLGYPWEAGTHELGKAASARPLRQGRTPGPSSGSLGVLWSLQTVVSHPFPLYATLYGDQGRFLLQQTNAEALRQA